MTTKTRQKLLLRACPRCQGDLFPDLEDKDMFGCLQCGRRVGLADVNVPQARKAELANAA